MAKREPPDDPFIKEAYSAGGVCYRLHDGTLEVVLIATLGGSRWGLPKGHVGPGEAAIDAAQREIAEETGITGDAVRLLETIEYWFRSGPRRIHKFVDCFLVRYTSGSIAPQLAEVDDARWFAIEQALALISFPRERAVLEQVQRLWEAG